MKNLLVIIAIFLVSSCGGGGESKEEVKKVETIEDTITTGADTIIIDSDFDLTTDIKIKIEVLKNVVTETAFLNICKKETLLVNNDNCFLRTPLDKEGISMEITIPHKEQELKAEIWHYNVFIEPLIYEWSLDKDKEKQVWTLNIKN
jgi:hypothetical protein